MRSTSPPSLCGRLILSPFEPKHKRITAAITETRNLFVGAFADRVFAHAAPASRTFALCEKLHALGKPVLIIDDAANGRLLEFTGKV